MSALTFLLARATVPGTCVFAMAAWLAAQQPAFSAETLDDRSVRLTFLHSLRCLDVQALGLDDHVPIQQYRCNGGLNQTVRLRRLTGQPQRYEIVFAHSSGASMYGRPPFRTEWLSSSSSAIRGQTNNSSSFASVTLNHLCMRFATYRVASASRWRLRTRTTA